MTELTADIGPCTETTVPPRLSSRAGRVPLVPQTLLSRHSCFVPNDTRYRAAARLRHSIWRDARGLGIGQHRLGDRPDGQLVPMGSRLTTEAGRDGANFISREVYAYARREVALSEDGALIEFERLTLNLLSSTAMSFNLFGPLALAPELATSVFRSLLPAFVHTVQDIRFETSPGRGDSRFLGDGTAFDIALDVITPDGELGTVFIEIKFTEGATGPSATPRPRYDEVSRELSLFVDPDSPTLRTRAVEQFWRLHMLAGLAVRQAVTPRAMFVTIAPALNRRVDAALRVYAGELAQQQPLSDQDVGFVALTLETVVAAIHAAGDYVTAAALTERYLDLQPVLDLVLADPSDLDRAPPNVPAPAAPAEAAFMDSTGPEVELRKVDAAECPSSTPVLASPSRPRRRATFTPARSARHRSRSGVHPARTE